MHFVITQTAQHIHKNVYSFLLTIQTTQYISQKINVNNTC